MKFEKGSDPFPSLHKSAGSHFVNDPAAVRLPQREIPSPGFDLRCPAPDLRHEAYGSRAARLGEHPFHVNRALIERDVLLGELRERSVERLLIERRPYVARRSRVEDVERSSITAEDVANRAVRFDGGRSRWRHWCRRG